MRRQPSSPGRTAFAWQLAVGPALGRATTVELARRRPHGHAPTDARWTREIERARATRPRAACSICSGRRRSAVASSANPVRDQTLRNSAHDHARIRHRLRRPHADRQVPRRAQGLHRRRSSARWSCAKPSARAGIDPGDRRRMHHGQRRPGRPRPEPGAAGGAQRRARRPRRRADDQQGLRLGPEGGDARGAGHRDRRHRHRRRRRHGVDEQRAVPAAARARGAAHGQRRRRRLDDQRRPVVRVRALPHGHVRRGRRRARITSTRDEQDAYAAESHRKAAHATARGLVQGRDPAGHDPAEEGRRRSSSIATSRSAPTRPPSRSAR